MREIPDWGYVIISVMVLYAGTALQLRWLEKQIEAGFSLVREELALLAGNKERAAQLRKEWKEERAKKKRAFRLLLVITSSGVIGAAAGLAWWWFTKR